jgi:AcrR family transcriptional regulator
MFKNIFSVRAILAADANRGRPQMPYAPEHKEQTRARIVECARRMFNRHGFEAVSIDQIMASAGLTRGGFYHHFANKEALHSRRIRTATWPTLFGYIMLSFARANVGDRT